MVLTFLLIVNAVIIWLVLEFPVLITVMSVHGVTQNFFLSGSSTKKCNHDCDQALIKSSWLSV